MQNATLIYKINIVTDWKRFKTSDWNHKLTCQVFNRVVHEVKKYGCFSVDSIKVSKAEESPPAGIRKNGHLQHLWISFTCLACRLCLVYCDWINLLCRNFFFFFSSTKQNSNSTIFAVPSVHAAILWTCTTFKMQLFQSSGGVSLNCYFSPSCNSSPVIRFFSNLWLDAALGDHAPACLKETPPLLLLFLVIRYPPAGWGCCHCLLSSFPGQTAERVRTWPYSPYFASSFFFFTVPFFPHYKA